MPQVVPGDRMLAAGTAHARRAGPGHALRPIDGAGEGRGAWDAQGWYGGDYNKLWIKTEGRYVGSGAERGVRDADLEALFDRVIARWWNLQAGLRQDIGSGQARTWLALGIAGSLCGFGPGGVRGVNHRARRGR